MVKRIRFISTYSFFTFDKGGQNLGLVNRTVSLLFVQNWKCNKRDSERSEESISFLRGFCHREHSERTIFLQKEDVQKKISSPAGGSIPYSV